MIPHLLWRCPVCATNDALVHTTRWLSPDRLVCTHCDAHWQVRRVMGDNFYLKLGSANPPVERSITAWYDELKKTLRLEAIREPEVTLTPGEDLHLASQLVEYWADDSPGPGRREAEGLGALLDRGRLYLTNRRLIWRGETSSEAFPLETIHNVSAILTLGIAVNCGPRLVFFRLPHESPLKWVTYFAMVAPKIETASGHKLATSHY